MKGGLHSQIGSADATSTKSEPVKPPYAVHKKGERTYKKNLAKDTTYNVKFNDQWQGKRLQDIHKELQNMFEDVLQQVRTHDADLGRVVVNHPNLFNPIVVPLQYVYSYL